MTSKIIVVASSCRGYETASDYLTKTKLGSAIMAFFPHIQPHLIRDSLRHQSLPFSPIKTGVVLYPGTFYIGTTKNFEVDEMGYSSGLQRKISILKQDSMRHFKIHPITTPSPTDDAFMAAYHSFKENTVCVILRGAGDDGVNGAKYIHERGGKVIIEDLPGGTTEFARYKIPDAEIISPPNIPERLEEMIN